MAFSAFCLRWRGCGKRNFG